MSFFAGRIFNYMQKHNLRNVYGDCVRYYKMQIEKKVVLQVLSSVFEGLSPDGNWVSQEELIKTLLRVRDGIEEEFSYARERLGFVFSKEFDLVVSTRETKALIRDWSEEKGLLSATAMLCVALEQFGIDAQSSFGKAILAAGVLAEVKNDLPYHNNLHFRKVLLHVIRMIMVHNNDIFKGTTHQLSQKDITKLIVGACIHDIGHEGKGNFISHKYHFAMTEQRSFFYAYPYLRASGLDDEILSDIKVMLMTTDVSPVGDPLSPVNQLRAIYEDHFGMDEERESEDAVSEELLVLVNDHHLCFLCVMLQEADIMNSAGVSYDVTRLESIAISQEMGLLHALPEDTMLFLETICRGRLLSDAARFLAEENLEQISRRVLKDFRNGNKSYL